MYSLACFHMYSLPHATACNVFGSSNQTGLLVVSCARTNRQTESTLCSQTNASVINLRYELSGAPILTERVAPKEGL